MRIPEVLSPLLSLSLSLYSLYPFFFWFFYGLSLSFPHTLLSLSFAPLLAKGWGMNPRGEGACGQGRVNVMRIPEFLSLGRGTSTRSELNFLLSLPFFLLVFLWYLSLSCPNTLLSLSVAPNFYKVWGMAPRGKSYLNKESERE